MATIEEKYRAKYAKQAEDDAAETADLDAYFGSPEGAQTVVRKRVMDLSRGYTNTSTRPMVQDIEGKPAVFVGGEQVFPSPKQRESYLKRQQTRLREQAEQNPPADLSARAGMGLKISPTGKANFLMHKYGEDRVFQTDDGRLGYIDKEGRPRLADKGPGLDTLAAAGVQVQMPVLGGPIPLAVLLATSEKARDAAKEYAGDVLDMGSEVLRILPGAVATYATRRAGGVKQLGAGAAGDVLGSALAQGVSAAIPGEENISREDRLKDVAMSAAAGAAPGAAIMAGKGAIRAVGPAQRYERQIADVVTSGKSAKELSPVISEGMRLEKTVGGPPLAASELANTETAHGLYNTLRKGPAAQYIKETDMAKSEALEAFATKNIRAVTSGADSGGAAGRAGEAWNNHIKDLMSKRSSVAAQMFDRVEAASKGRPVISVANTMRVQKEIASKFGSSFSTATGEQIVNGVTSRFKTLNEMAKTAPGGVPTLRARDFQNALSQWSKAASGSEMAIEGLEGRAVQRKIARMVERALRADLDDTAKLSTRQGGGVAQGLLDARQFYAQMSDAIESRDVRLLRDAFKLESKGPGSSEKMARIIARGNYQPHEIRTGMAVLAKASPDVAMEMRAAVLEEMLIHANRSGQFSPEALVRVLSDRRKQDTLKALMADSPDSGEFFKGMVDAFRYGERVSKRGTTAGGSPTAPYQWMSRMMTGVPLAGQLAVTAREAMVKLSNPRNLARAMNSTEGRKALLKIADPRYSRGGEESARALVQLGGILSGESILYDESVEEMPLPRKEPVQ